MIDTEKQSSKDLTLQKRLFTFLFSKKVPPLPLDEERVVIPEKKSNPLSQLLFLWITPILQTGYKRTLQYEDTFKMDDEEKIDTLYKSFAEKFKNITDSRADEPIRRRDILKALYYVLGYDFWLCICSKAVFDVLQSVSPLLLKKLTDFVEESTLVNVRYGKGVGYALGCSFMVLVMNLGMNYSFYRGAILGAKTRSVLMRVLLKKSCTVDAQGNHLFPSSKVSSIMSTDLNRIDMACIMVTLIFSSPLSLIISVVFLIVNLGVSSLAGLACFFLVFFAVGFFFKSLVKYRAITTKFTDLRVKLTKELLYNFKMVKYYSWEKFYSKRIVDARNNEMKYTLHMQMQKNFLMSIIFALPSLSSMVALLTAYRVSPGRSAGDIFSSISLFQAVSMVFFFIPQAIGSGADAKVALGRIAEYLNCKDSNNEEYFISSLEDGNIAVEVSDATFKWDKFSNLVEEEKDGKKKKKQKKQKKEKKEQKENEKMNKVLDEESISSTEKMHGSNVMVESIDSKQQKQFVFNGLQDLDFKIEKGDFVVVAGPIGCGKSSLLFALAGFMKRVKGSVAIMGESILCGTPWVKNDTIRENIIFGLPYDEKKYRAVIEACSLNQDFEQFDGGDLTEVGERGVTLSGGQKARVNLARSVYADKDIYYLDDVLSAVDAKVGKHIVDHCITGLLKDKTVVLATHQIGLIQKANKLMYINTDGTLSYGVLKELRECNAQVDDFFRYINTSDAVDLQLTAKNDVKEKEDVFEYKENEEAVRIIADEERAVNGIGYDVFKTYFQLGFGVFKLTFIPIFLSVVTLSTFTTYFADTWLTFWINDKFEHRGAGFYMGLYIMFNFLFTIFTGMEFILIGYFCVTASKKLNILASKRLLHAPIVFTDTTPLGRILNRFTKDTDVLDNEIVDQFRMAIYPMGMVVGNFILCIIYLPWFALAVPIISTFYVFFTSYFQATSREMKRIDAIFRSFVYTHFNETLEGLTTIKSYGRENYFLDRLCDLMDNNNEAYFLTWALQRWIVSMFTIVNFFFVLIISLLCCFRVFNISAAATGLLLSYCMVVPNLLSLAVRCLAQIETEFNSVERLSYYAYILPQEPAYEIPENDPVESWPQSGKIEFRNTSFKYRPELPYVIKDLSLKIEGGEKVGICGRTGAGKSTFLTCLYRLTEFEGEIDIDNVDISTLGLHKLRSGLTIIPQDPVLFVGDIRSNLDPFDEYDDHELWGILVTAGLIKADDINEVKVQKKEDSNLHKFHLDNDVEDNGSNFSLGERQLIALARALIRKCKILLLDEATSSVDHETDSQIQRTIATQFEDCTIISIAHRLKTILTYDKIVVMNAGQIVQFDTPWKLFNDLQGEFRSMCEESGITEADF